MNKQNIIVGVYIDWSHSFVDENGSFYCGTTKEEKLNGVKIASICDLVINTTDLHPITAPEHNINGGLYPAHNAVMPERYDSNFVYYRTPDGTELKLQDKTMSPRLTKIIDDALIGRRRAMIVPKSVYFQAGACMPMCTPYEIEATFDTAIIEPSVFINEDIDYIIAPKQYFDATRLDSDFMLPQGRFGSIPQMNYNVFSLLERKFPASKYTLTFINTGVVEGICRLNTSIGERQMPYNSRIINISDASTPLIGFGFESVKESRDACMKVCQNMGIEYKTTAEVLAEFGRK